MVEVISIISIGFGILSGIISGGFTIVQYINSNKAKIKELQQKNLEDKLNNLSDDFEDLRKRMISLEKEGDVYVLNRLQKLEQSIDK